MPPYQRKSKTPAELSELRSLAARSRKSHKGGRPRDPDAKRISHNIGLHPAAYEVFRTLAAASGKTIADFMDVVAESLKMKNPRHFPSA